MADKQAPTQKKTSKAVVKATNLDPDEIAEPGIELGIDMNMPFTTPFRPISAGIGKTQDEELQEILHGEYEELGPTVRQLIAMRRMDGQARALYRLLTLPIRSALTTAKLVPGEDGEAEADFIDQVFNLAPAQGGMTVTFHRFMSQMLQGLFDGFAAFEKVFWIPTTGPLKGKITLKKLAHRPSETVTFITNKKGGFEGLRQRAYGVGGKTTDVYIAKPYAFYYAAQEEERKFYGVSFFQSAFYHYDKKVRMYYIAHLAAQRAAVGTRVGTVPNNATVSAKQEFAQALSNLALAQWMSFPEGYKVEMLKESGNYDFLAQINHHNSQMSKSVLAAFFDKDQGAGQNEGSLVNFAAPGDGMFLMMLRAVMDDIANQINHYIIPQLIDLNFKSGIYPKFTWGKLTDEQKAAIASTFDKLATVAKESQGVTPEFMRALEETQAAEFGLDIDYDEVEAREQAEAEAASAQEQASQIDPVTGQPIGPQPGAAPGDDQPPADDSAPNESGADASGAPTPPPAGSGDSTPASTPPSSDAPAPDASSDQQQTQQDATNPDSATSPNWTIQDFEKAVFGAGKSDSPTPEDDSKINDLEDQVGLSIDAEDGLLILAQQMLDIAKGEMQSA